VKINCRDCGEEFEIEPPPWVVSSGREFETECPACHATQKARPTTGLALPAGVSAQDVASPKARKTAGGSLLRRRPSRLRARRAAPRPAAPAAEPSPETAPPAETTPVHAAPVAETAPVPETTPEETEHPPAPDASNHESEENKPVGGVSAIAHQDPTPIALTSGPFAPTNDMDRPPPAPPTSEPDVEQETTTVLSQPPEADDAPTVMDEPAEEPSAEAEPVFQPPASDPEPLQLRQDGEVYTVPDVAILQTWIMERRVEQTDELSEDGGATWTTIADRPDLRLFLQAVAQLEAKDDEPKEEEPAEPEVEEFEDPMATAEIQEEFTAEAPTVLMEEEDLPPLDMGDPSFPGGASAFQPSFDSAEDAPGGDSTQESPRLPTEEAITDSLAPDPISDEGNFFIPDNGGEPDFDPSFGEFEEFPTSYRRSRLPVFVFLGLVAAGLLSIVAVNASKPDPVVPDAEIAAAPEAPATEAPADAQPPAPEPTDVAEAEPATAPPAKPVPVQAVAKPAPTPKPKPTAVAKAAPTPRAARANQEQLVEEGWEAVERDRSTAIKKFEAALKLDKNDPEALYGYGYALLRSGRKSEALPNLCRAQSIGPRDVKQEVGGILRNAGMTCD